MKKASPTTYKVGSIGAFAAWTVAYDATAHAWTATKGSETHVLTGVEMFVRQAGLQFKLFTGKEAPLDLMDKLVRRALSPVLLRDED